MVELASAKIVDGEFTLSGEIEESTEVTITAKAGGEELELTATVLLVPNGEEMSLVLVDNRNDYPSDRLYVLGTSYGSKDPTKKLSITGDFSNVVQDVNKGAFGAYGQKLENGEMVSFWLGTSCLMKENS